ncbi:unnamed protein product [Oppiella nova]|uniref:Uncharacterized protein n=1 Tax=Oppiella nova TaxID=334625 RepID=A0A7R9M5E1_9ACAR|nr:unnamed protein product [Oppiella nova]CAG2170564.1 unnamed protein product [Oppiella nova]
MIAGQRQCANETQTCGGFIGTACCDGQGLTCKLDDQNGQISDAQGTCIKKGGSGKTTSGLACIKLNGICGGFANAQCCTGFRCQYMTGSDAGHCVNGIRINQIRFPFRNIMPTF